MISVSQMISLTPKNVMQNWRATGQLLGYALIPAIATTCHEFSEKQTHQEYYNIKNTQDNIVLFLRWTGRDERTVILFRW